jgi:DNA-binding Xre family transcriptional regulator
MGEIKVHKIVIGKKLKGRGLLTDLDIDGRTLNKLGGVELIRLFPVTVFCEHDNKPVGFIKR